MFILLLSVQLLLTLHFSSANEEAKKFTYKDPKTGRQWECDRCPPGTYMRSPCTPTVKTVCEACPSGSYTGLWNHIRRCLRCNVCDINQVSTKECTADSDIQCECNPGYYSVDGMCVSHTVCPMGEGVQVPGTATQDTVCQVCQEGTFSDIASNQQSCKPYKSCEASGLKLVLKGNGCHDSVCTSCEELKSKDGAEYLREVLPALFANHKVSPRRLRQLVHKLNTENGHGTYSDCLEWINKWIPSATAKQLRDLPTVLKDLGVIHLSDKIQSKLTRIDSRVKGLCTLENDVLV